MVGKSLVATLGFSALLAPCVVHADIVTLFIPDSLPVALSADVLGTDGAGRTTWRLAPGQPSDTLSSDDFPVATMVEGPSDVHYFAEKDGSALYDDCTIKDGVAVCTGVFSKSGTATTVWTSTQSVATETFPVQITGLPKNGAGRVASSTMGVVAVLMGVVYLVC